MTQTIGPVSTRVAPASTERYPGTLHWDNFRPRFRSPDEWDENDPDNALDIFLDDDEDSPAGPAKPDAEKDDTGPSCSLFNTELDLPF